MDGKYRIIDQKTWKRNMHGFMWEGWWRGFRSFWMEMLKALLQKRRIANKLIGMGYCEEMIF